MFVVMMPRISPCTKMGAWFAASTGRVPCGGAGVGGVVVDLLPFSPPPPRSGALLRGELGCTRRTHGSKAGYIARVGAARSADAHVHVR